MKKKILIVDDEILLGEFLEITFKRQNYEVFVAHNIKDGFMLFKKNAPDAIIIDLKLPDGSGIDLLKSIYSENQNIVAVLITAYGNIDTAVEAMRFGAADFITKPFSAEHISAAVEKAFLKTQNGNKEISEKNERYYSSINKIIGNCQAMQNVFEIMKKITNTDATVLITGESGTGKELIARYLHYHSDINANPFVTVNCSAIPDTLLESELFGHKRGSFTGAHADKIGLFEAADNGVIFLDEIGDITPALQVKLLRVIEDKKITPIGAVTPKKINVRIIAATNKELEREVAASKFREDLFYRLNIIRIQLPALRERGDDIVLLADFFLDLFKRQFNKKITRFSDDAIDEIKNYQWPGNIRELENLIKRAIILSDKNILTATDLFGNSIMKLNAQNKNDKLDNIEIPEAGVDLNNIIETIEKKHLEEALKKAGFKQTEAARLLNINRTTLIAKLKKYNLEGNK